MNKFNKVKKTINKSIEDKIILWEVLLFDSSTGEQIRDIKIITNKYNLKLSNNKQFMKKWTDRKLWIAIKKDLTLLEKEILFDILDYIDTDSLINFKLLALDYWYAPSKISKAKNWLKEKELIKESNWFYYLSPLVWIKSTEVPQELMELFKDSFERYGVEITY
jgi:hypothetical protein